jgi:hypothetical protein
MWVIANEIHLISNVRHVLDAASDAYSALEVYNRIRDIGAEHNIQTELQTLVDAKSKPTRTSLVQLSASDRASAASSSVSTRPDVRAEITTARIVQWEKKSLTKQKARAYALWHVEKIPLDEICARLRTPDNPLKRSTVM